MRYVAIRGKEVDVEAVNVEENWESERTLSADELSATGVRGKLKEVKLIWEDGGEAKPAPLLKLVDLSPGVEETKRDSPKLSDRTNDLIMELYEVVHRNA